MSTPRTPFGQLDVALLRAAMHEHAVQHPDALPCAGPCADDVARIYAGFRDTDPDAEELHPNAPWNIAGMD